MLRQRPAAQRTRCPHLHLRVHVLRRVCRQRAAQRLSQLRRRVRAAPNPPGHRAASRRLPRQTTGFDATGPLEMAARGRHGVCPERKGYRAGAPLAWLLACAESATQGSSTADRKPAMADSCNVLMIYPKFNPRSFWSYDGACELLGAKYPAAPLGMITLRRCCPPPGTSAWSTATPRTSTRRSLTGPTWS